MALDLTGLLDMFGHDRAKVTKLLHRFVESSNAGLAEMQACLASGDVQRMRELGHRIKSAARMVGALPLAAMCERMEKLPQTDAPGERSAAAALLAQLLALLADASTQIDAYLLHSDPR